MGPIGMPEMIMIFIVILLLVMPILAIVALASCIPAKFSDPNQKLIWVLVILFLPVIGSILYFTMSPKQRIG